MIIKKHHSKITRDIFTSINSIPHGIGKMKVYPREFDIDTIQYYKWGKIIGINYDYDNDDDKQVYTAGVDYYL